MTKLKFERVVCACGNVYPVKGKADHECFYTKFFNKNDAYSASKLIKKVVNHET